MPPNTRKHGEALDIALDLAGPALNILDTALDIISVPGLGLVPKSLSIVIERVKACRANKASREAFVDNAQTLASLIEKTAGLQASLGHHGGDESQTEQAMYEIIHSMELRKGVDELSSAIQELQQQADTLKGRHGFRGIAKGFLYASRDKATLEDMQERLANAIDTFKVQSHLAIDRGVQEILRLARDTVHDKIIDKLAWADVGYRAVDHIKSGFMDGTREALMDDLRLRLAGPLPEDDSKRFCLLLGGAGTGKSAAAHRLCRHLADDDFSSLSGTVVLGASFFFVRGGGDNESALLLFPTIARQLALCPRLSAIRPYLLDGIHSYTQQGNRQQIQYAFEELIRKPLLKASGAVPRDLRVVIIIDGLDECAHQDLMQDALELLFTLVRALPWLSIFAASRPEPHIMAAVTSQQAKGVVYTRDLTGESSSPEDVKFYLENTVPKIGDYADFLRDYRTPLSALVSRADGLFIFARVAVNVLSIYHDDPEEGFEVVLSTEGEGLTPLDTLYLRILQLAFPADKMRRSSRLHARLLAFLYIIVLCEGLPCSAIAVLGQQLCETVAIRSRLPGKIDTLVGLLEKDTVNMVNRLRSVLVIDAQGIVAALHATFREFLCDPRRCSDLLYYVDEHEGRASIVSAHLSLISLENAITYLCSPDSEHGLAYCVRLAIANAINYMRKDQCSGSSAQDIATFVRGVQIPIAIRLCLTFPFPEAACMAIYAAMPHRGPDSTDIEPREADPSFGSKSNLDRSPDDQYIRFAAYSALYWGRLRTTSDTRPPEIAADEVRKWILQQATLYEASQLQETAALWADDHIDIVRYQSTMETLRKEIDKDERARSLWYNFSISDR